ncbi:MAG: GNAT family N-acetyltransferase [Nocardioides sp.]
MDYLIVATGQAEVNNSAIPYACPSILAGLEGGHDAFLYGLAQVAVGQMQSEDRTTDAAFSLVATNAADEVLGSITCSPPYDYMHQLLDMISGLSPRDADRLVLSGQMALCKVIGVAVREDLRGRGIGADLIRTAQRVLKRCGTGLIMFGSCQSDHVKFYRRLGFNVAAKDEPLDLQMVFGFKALISTPEQHIFNWSRSPGDR